MDLVIRISVVHIILGRGSMGMCSMAEGIEGEAWCEIGLVAQELDRSLYTVDGWVRKGRAGVKLRSRREGSRRYGRTLVDMAMARAMDLEAPRAGERSVKVGLEDSEKPARIYRVDLIRESDGQGKWDYNDTWAKVVGDRKKWVRGWVEQGLPLARVLCGYSTRTYTMR